MTETQPQLEPSTPAPDPVTALLARTVPFALAVTTYTELVRHPRGKCVACGFRRVLYSLVTTGDSRTLGTIESLRLCARDAGIHVG